MTYDDWLPHRSVHAALDAAAARHADRPALAFVESDDLDAEPRRWTYTDFVADVRRAANLFRSLADSAAPRIAILLPPIPEAYVALWGAETAGVACPINFMLDASHVAGLVEATGAEIVVALGPDADLDVWSKVERIRETCASVRHVLAVGADAAGADPFAEALARQPGDRLAFDRAIDRDTLAALFHTGGTTGAPKLARHTHGNQLHAAWGAACRYALTERDVLVAGFPIFHVAGAFVYGLSTWLAGASVVLPTKLGLRHPGYMRRYWSFAARERATLLAAVPTVMAGLLAADRADADAADRSRIRALYTGGSPLPTELADAFEQRFAVPVRNILGMTESAGVIAIEPFAASRTPGSCGVPLPYTTVEALAADGRTCAPGESGILRVRGPNVSPGYTDARRDAGTFTDGGWLVSGDIGHVDAEGRVFVTGRAKDVIIRGGHNIDPGPIEEALLAHPAVQMAAAVGAPDAYAGELPVAFVTLRPGATVDDDELRAFAALRVPERPAAPKRVDVLPALPLTAVGKVYKPALRALAAERVIADAVTAAGLADAARIVVDETAGGLAVRFTSTTDDVDGVLREVMRPFAMPWRVDR